MLAEGFTTRRGRRGSLLHHDAVNHMLRGRRGARTTALTSGGMIPDTADYQVLLEPENQVIGSVNEDFVVESMAGDIFQLGNVSYRILRVERGERCASKTRKASRRRFLFGWARRQDVPTSFRPLSRGCARSSLSGSKPTHQARPPGLG